MRKILCILTFCILAVSAFAQQNDVLGRLSVFVETATLDYQEQKYDLCEKKLNEYVALYAEQHAIDSTLVHPTWLYIPCVMLGNIAEQQDDIDKAIEFYEYAFTISVRFPKELLAGGINMDGYVGVWISLKEAYSKKGNKETALDLAKEIVTLCRTQLPDNLATQLCNLGVAYQDMDMYDDAISSYKESLNISMQANASEMDAKNTLIIFGNLIAYQYKASKYGDAVDSVDEYKDFLNTIASMYPEGIYTANKIIAQCYYQLNLFERAFSISFRLVNDAYNLYGDISTEHANMVGNLAQLCLDYYEARPDEVKVFDIAEENYEKCFSIWSKIPDKDRYEDYATFLNNYGLFFSSLDDYKNAEQHFLSALHIYEKLGAKPSGIVSTLGNLAGVYWEQENVDEAYNNYKKAMELCESIGEVESQQYANLLEKMARLYLTAYGDEAAADKYANEAYVILSKLDNRNLSHVGSLQLLGRIYHGIGDYSRSFDIQAQAILMKFGIDKGLTVSAHEWINLGETASRTGAYEATETAINNALEELEEFPNEGQRARALDILGYALLGQEKFAEAEPILLEAATIRKELFGTDSIPYDASLSSLIALYSLRGDFEKAEKIILEALTINDDLKNQANAVALYYLKGDVAGIEKHLSPFYHTSIDEIKRRFLFLSETQRDAYINSDEVAIENIISFSYRFPGSDICTRYAYNTSLVTKGLLLNTSQSLHKLIDEIRDSQARSDYETMVKLQQALNNVTDSLQYEQIAYQISLKEKSLQQFISKYDDFTKHLDFQWSNVKAQLKNNDVAIEFIDFYDDNEENIYGALLLRHDWDAPKMITLFEQPQLENLTRVGISKSYGGYVGKQIAKLIWSPLAEYINDGDNVYFSPSGILHHLAIESLPTEDGRLMSEKYNIYRLSTTKQLCYDHPNQEYDKAVLYGGLTYDLDENVMVAESRTYSTMRDLYATRGFEADTLYRGAGWENLPGTRIEVENISKTLDSQGIKKVLFEGQAGNEESFRALSGERYPIIHIATHGFFLPLQKARKQDYFNLLSDELPMADNSMRRSGLILAGGNKAWQGEPVPEGIEDGVLTAQEILSLDLRGADLVVLSACETGLGEVSGEGVFGLQRAFKKAGAQTLIMSLWKVSDAATETMMSEFYTHFLAGKSKREAFLAAQSSVREKYPEPYYWAAFIMLD